eukprot:CAMPEP_0177607636 /NCGR_PEP_ID=MMETSP0419_2-20121207/18028_1 /TAXON_ID=582737 /ORGANISM="Tetraselmis sp., Strain GSL018" /LENGTH=474 /DNA_ID=CAMNT_0019102241 /DNA_START=463 /DNA_END=1882 /DNA_ORIENTATION=+
MEINGSKAFEFVEEDSLIYAERQRLLASEGEAAVNSQWPLEDTRAREAWLTTRGSTRILVGLVDTGLDVTHPDLAGALWRNPLETANGRDDDGNGVVDDIHGANFDMFPPSGDLEDTDGHGTHVAGIIAGRGNAPDGIRGMARVSLVGCKALGSLGRGSLSSAIRCMEYLLEAGVDAIVASWGTYSLSRAMEVTVRAAEKQGVVFVSAAGNEGSNNDVRPHFPSGFRTSTSIAVAASTELGGLWTEPGASSSNFGLGTVDIAAPGARVVSTYKGGTTAGRPASPLEAIRGGAAKVVDSILAGAACTDGLMGSVITGGKLDAAASMRYLADVLGSTRQDCVVSCWRNSSVGVRERSVLVEPSVGGAACPPLREDIIQCEGGRCQAVGKPVPQLPWGLSTLGFGMPGDSGQRTVRPAPPPPPPPQQQQEEEQEKKGGAPELEDATPEHSKGASRGDPALGRDCQVGPWGPWGPCRR